jgi:hypothetical protein
MCETPFEGGVMLVSCARLRGRTMRVETCLVRQKIAKIAWSKRSVFSRLPDVSFDMCRDCPEGKAHKIRAAKARSVKAEASNQ